MARRLCSGEYHELVIGLKSSENHCYTYLSAFVRKEERNISTCCVNSFLKS
jgi:hypothetical protein